MRYVLFVCNHNAGRSQMAQAFFERHAPADVRAESAGSAPFGGVADRDRGDVRGRPGSVGPQAAQAAARDAAARRLGGHDGLRRRLPVRPDHRRVLGRAGPRCVAEIAGDEHRNAPVVNLASMAGKSPEPWLSVYSATKAAVVAYSEAMNKELGAHGVKSVALCPGFVDTDMSDFVKDRIPAEDMLKTSDVAEALRLPAPRLSHMPDPRDHLPAQRRVDLGVARVVALE